MKTKQTAPVNPSLFADTTPDSETLLQALDECGLLFPLLQAGMVNGYFADKNSARAMVLDWQPDSRTLRLSIQYESQMAGCACDDDPTPQQPSPEFLTCSLSFDENGWLAHIELED